MTVSKSDIGIRGIKIVTGMERHTVIPVHIVKPVIPEYTVIPKNPDKNDGTEIGFWYFGTRLRLLRALRL